LDLLFSAVKLCIKFVEKWDGPHFGRLFYKNTSGHPVCKVRSDSAATAFVVEKLFSFYVAVRQDWAEFRRFGRIFFCPWAHFFEKIHLGVNVLLKDFYKSAKEAPDFGFVFKFPNCDQKFMGVKNPI
jgi:hypothetical protein